VPVKLFRLPADLHRTSRRGGAWPGSCPVPAPHAGRAGARGRPARSGTQPAV